MNSRHLRRAASSLTAACAVTALLQCGASASAAESATTVAYHGLTLQVPAHWTVVDLAADPHTCVRMDQHTVYLGHPGTEQNCPTHVIAEKTEAIVLETFAGAGPRYDIPQVDVPAGSSAPKTLPATDSREARLAFEGAGVYLTASHGASQAAIDQLLSTVGTDAAAKPQSAPSPAPQAGRRTAALAAVAPSTGYKGKAFDACSAPSSGAMGDWASSPYRGVAVYMGGPSRACAQPNLSAAWVSQRSADGWHVMPIYAGLQAASISSSSANSQGRAAADAAVGLAQDLGFAPGTVLYIDMESYSSGYRSTVLDYLSGWTERIQELHYRSGVYSSSSSGINDLSDVYSSSTLKRPDVVWMANWNGQADTDDSFVPASQWADHQRVHQYAGNVTETYGGTTIQIDRDYVDVGTATTVADPGMTNLTAGDFNGDGKADLVGVEVSTGKLWLYPNPNIGAASSRVEIGSGGWNGMANLAAGDLNQDGKDDIVGTEKSSGKLFLYKGTGSGLSSRTEIGSGGWNGMSNIFVGDFNGDGIDDVGGNEIDTGKLYLYKGKGDGTISGMSGRVEIGSGGWNGVNKVVSPGDMNKDGKDDLVATEKSTGKLYLYKGTGSGLSSRMEIGSGGWNGISGYAGADFSGDGVGDLAAVESDPGETGKLYLYKGTGSGGLNSRTEVGSGGW
ncbi:glycoside hydrolase domain-containing protein [Streptomyces sp. NPDC047017]|uniref:glycoside hydrolase domain-containing protein n=1 Tax=Streptomyces sp. NPDC047017 TaxID=3155024 RepID=UPI0033E1703F